MAADLEWIDWAKAEQVIKSLPPDTSYLVLRERLGGHERRVGRLAIHPSHLAHYLVPEAPVDEEDDEGDDEELEEDDEDGEELQLEEEENRGGKGTDQSRSALESATLPPQPSGFPARAALLVAATRWVRTMAETNLGFGEVTRFRLRAYEPKGNKPLRSVCFAVKDRKWNGEALTTALQPAPVSPTIPNAFVHMPVTELPRIDPREGQYAPYRALGQYYQQYGQVLAEGYGQLQSINTHMITGLYEQLRQSHHHRDTLVKSVVDLRTEQVERAESRHRADHAEGERNALAQKALEQLGEATKAVFVAQGISPEHMEVLDSLTGSPELMATLREPQVRQLMRDPNNLRALAGMLHQVAGQSQQSAPPVQPQAGMMPGHPQYGALPASAPHAPPAGYGYQAPPPGYGYQAPPPGYAPAGPPPGYAPAGPPPGYAPGAPQSANQPAASPTGSPPEALPAGYAQTAAPPAGYPSPVGPEAQTG